MQNSIEQLASLISRKFVFNTDAYGCQVKEEIIIFRTTYNKLDPTTIKYMLDNKQAFLTYQQNADKLQWICFDFDINKDVINANKNEVYDFFSDSVYRPKLIDDVKTLIQLLAKKNINHCVEFSGNRGVHVWIFFDKSVPKKLGYQIEQAILNTCNLKHSTQNKSGISVDLFPQTGSSRGNKVGKGVKLPLSYHMKSMAYSYILNDINSIEKIVELDESFIERQISLISKIQKNSIDKILQAFDKEELSKHSELKMYDCKRLQLKSTLSAIEVIEKLNKSIIYRNIFDKAPLFSEQDRLVLVGTFVRMRTNEDANYGKKILIEIFKQSPNYNEDITLAKLDQLKDLFPPTIKYLERIYNIKCDYCNEKAFTNSIELIDSNIIDIAKKSYFNFDWVKKAEQNYLTQNDECSLNFIHDEIEDLSTVALESSYRKIVEGKFYELPVFYQYDRKEINFDGNKKTRKLFSFSAKDRVLSTYCIYRMNSLLDAANNEYSFGYRLNKNSKFINIFNNWNSLWMSYVSLIDKKIESKSYENYYLIKLDISKFYDGLNHQYLLELLLQRTRKVQENFGITLSSEELTEYKNLCNYQIGLCEVSCGTVGVPQGPAFARYLAELYLASLDNDIMSLLDLDFDSYFRYVDDMVIIVKDKEKAYKIYKEIDEKFRAIYLEKNSEKCQIKKISEIKGTNFMGKNADKYFIDSSESVMMSTQLKQKIEAILEKLLGEDDLNIKELPFYLTHLLPEMVKSKKSEIIKKMIDNDIGRGSMFKHFYKRIVFNDEN